MRLESKKLVQSLAAYSLYKGQVVTRVSDNTTRYYLNYKSTNGHQELKPHKLFDALWDNKDWFIDLTLKANIVMYPNISSLSVTGAGLDGLLSPYKLNHNYKAEDEKADIIVIFLNGNDNQNIKLVTLFNKLQDFIYGHKGD